MNRSLKGRLWIALLSCTIVTILGIAGYMVIEGYSFLEAMYMTAITISTVGYGEPHTLDEKGKIFTICLIFLNVIVVGYSVALISTFFLEADLVKKYRIKKMNKKISELRHHVIICGYGRTGQESVNILRKNNIPVVVIEKDEHALTELKNLDGQLHVEMDSTTNEALITAGIHNARALITTLPSDADNVFVTLTASELNPKLLIVSRATNSSSIPKLKRAGAANVIMPYKIGGAHMASLVVNPDVKEFIDLISGHTDFSAHVEEIDLSASEHLFTGKTLGEIDLHGKTGINIIGLKIGDQYIVNPEDSAEYKKGLKLLVLGNASQFERLKELLDINK